MLILGDDMKKCIEESLQANDIIDCPYGLYQPMLFNVRKQHCIINNGNNFRYLMTVTISNVTFEDAVEFFKTYTIGNY